MYGQYDRGDKREVGKGRMGREIEDVAVVVVVVVVVVEVVIDMVVE